MSAMSDEESLRALRILRTDPDLRLEEVGS